MKTIMTFFSLIFAATAWPAVAMNFIETPSLKPLVESGELPPVAQRVPEEPYISRLEESGRQTGRHGGVLNTIMARSKDVRLMVVYGYARLVKFNRDLELEPDILKRVDVEEGRIFTLHLRKGHKWSDGKPFTTEDFRYYWEDVANHDMLSPTGPPAKLRVDGATLDFDALVVATPHDITAELLPDEAKVDRAALRALGASPIVNLHIVFDRRVCDFDFAAGVDTPVQWIFDRTDSSGVAARGRGEQCLAISLSAADAYVGISRDQLRARFVPQLERLFPAARAAEIRAFHVTCERVATFRGSPGTAALRPSAQTGVRSLFLSGAYTDTGWPATMEGAVRSGNRAAEAALQSVGLHGR